MSRMIQVQCDVCGRYNDATENLNAWVAMESGLIQTNQKYFGKQGGIDICPSCVLKVIEKIKEIKAV